MTERNDAGGAQPRREPQRRRRRRRRRRVLPTIGKILGTFLLVCVTTGLILTCFAAVYVNKVIIPEANKMDYLRDISLKLTSTMYYTDENGQEQEYLTISSDENRVWVPFEKIPKNLLNATVAIEDKRFYSHHGVDWIRTANGVLKMFTGGSVQGGSTLTQQLIKNITGENQTTVKRKITEIFRALEFDKKYSKDTTLEWYLNYIYFGERCYGIYTASYMYFGKDVTELSLAQCASLIGIPNNPSRYDPYLNKDKEVTNDMANRKRAKTILWAMFDQEFISEEEYDAACAEVDTMVFVQGNDGNTVNTTTYNWYQDQVITDVVNDLMEEYGWSKRVALDTVYYGGLSIYTNVDRRIQDIVDSVYSDTENLPYVSNSGQPMQSGIVVVDHAGKVVALSGGIGEKTGSRVWNRASDTKRPPGSSIKPLAIYAPAMEMGLLNPNSIVDDVPYQELGGKPWPVNAYGYYYGRAGLRFALAQSSNTVAVRVLGDMVTPEASFNFLENRFGITSLIRETWINDKKFSDQDLAPLALGGLTNGVSPYEMAAAYAAFPSMGHYVPPTTYSKVVDAEGTVLLDNSDKGEYILKESTAYYMTELLKEVVSSRGTGGSAALSGMPVAGKTGTTTDEKDLWFVGYTPYYTAAVWTGYDRQERMRGVGLPTTALWKKVMSQVHEGLEYKDFDTPSDVELVTASYCLDSGMKPGPYCSEDVRGSRVATGTYIKGDEPTRTCDLHVGIEVCTASTTTTEPEEGEKAETTYCLAGEFCPVDTIKTVGVLDYVREGAAAEVTPRDAGALKSKWDEAEVCHVHGAVTDPNSQPFDPNDPDTWPVDDPDFDINNPETWPEVLPPVDDDPNGGGENGEHSQPPETGGESEPPEVTPPVEDEPFIPAGGG